MLCFPGFAYYVFFRSGISVPRPHPRLNSLKVKDSRRTEFPRDFGPGVTEFPRELGPHDPDPKVGGEPGDRVPCDTGNLLLLFFPANCTSVRH